jgi:hypothetical protein
MGGKASVNVVPKEKISRESNPGSPIRIPAFQKAT